MLQPEPGGLNHDAAHKTIAGLRYALAVPALAAVVRAGCKADEAGDLTSVGELSVTRGKPRIPPWFGGHHRTSRAASPGN